MARLWSVWSLIFILSFFMAAMLALGLPSLFASRQLVKKGDAVKVSVETTSESHFGKRHAYFLHFKYDGRERVISVGRDYMAHVKTLQSTDLLHSTEYPDLFLQPGFNDEGQLLSGSILIAFFVFLDIFSAIRLVKNKK